MRDLEIYKIKIKISQRSLILSILYLFYNADIANIYRVEEYLVPIYIYIISSLVGGPNT